MSDIEELFQGIAVVIDDEIGTDAGKNIDAIILEIENAHSHVVKLTKLPIKDKLKNLDGASFIILDWEFSPLSKEDKAAGVKLPDAAKGALEKENIDFLNELNKTLFLPIFIITHAGVEYVSQVLIKNKLIKGDDGDHIFVKSKDEVVKVGLFKILQDWIKGHPSAYVLKKWDKAYTKAKNDLFIEFYKNSRYWPLVIWEANSNDGVPPAVELGNLIARNIDSRTSPVDFDEEILAKMHASQIEKISAEEVKNVLAGERLISETFLSKDSYSTGDIFLKKKKGKSKYYINIRPKCDCTVRNGEEVNESVLYLLRGCDLTPGQTDHDGRSIIEPDYASVIFAAYDGKTLSFNFKDLTVITVRELLSSDDYKFERIGRLIPPYITRLLQRYTAYLQRTGLPSIPKIALPARAEETEVKS